MSAPRSVVLWHPGTFVATADVAAGLVHGLTAHDVYITPYATSAHIATSGYVLQKAWRLGKKSQPKPTAADTIYWASKGILERALRARVEHGSDWVIVISGMYQHPDMVLFLKKAGFKVAVILTESPYDMFNEARYISLADVAFTNERTSVAALRAANPHTYYLQHAWHPGVHQVATAEEDADVPAHDVVFVGTGFIERVKLLAAIDWTGIDFGLYGIWELAPPRSRVRRYLREAETRNTRTAALYRAAKVGLNLHRTSQGFGPNVPHITTAESLNPRAYELAATGLCFASDYRPEIRDVFGDVLPTFSTAAEAGAVLRALLADDSWRHDLAAQCRERVQPHTWTARAGQVLDVLDAYDAAASAA